MLFFFFSSRRRHTRLVSDWSSDVCSSDLTDMTRAINEKTQVDWATQIPLGRLGTVDDVAAAACFLASDEASYITGHRSEERRVGKECRARWSTHHSKRKMKEE